MIAYVTTACSTDDTDTTSSRSGNVMYIRNGFQDIQQDDDREELAELHRQECRKAWKTFSEIRKVVCSLTKLELTSNRSRFVRFGREKSWTGKNFRRSV